MDSQGVRPRRAQPLKQFRGPATCHRPAFLRGQELGKMAAPMQKQP